jgi:hypothetical protein
MLAEAILALGKAFAPEQCLDGLARREERGSAPKAPGSCGMGRRWTVRGVAFAGQALPGIGAANAPCVPPNGAPTNVSVFMSLNTKVDRGAPTAGVRKTVKK